jgi:electron transfer flavoprotein beta subunit
VSAIDAVDPEQGTITVRRRADHGVQVLSSRLPAMITMLEGSNQIRRGTQNDVLRAARSDITQWNAAGVGIEDLSLCGLRGSPTVVKRVFAPSARSEKATIISSESGVAATASALIEAILERQPALETDLLEQASGY